MLALMSALSDGKASWVQKCSLIKCGEWEESERTVLKVLAVDETSALVH